MRLALTAALIVPAVVYTFSISPNPGFGDFAEMATVSYLFGIAHTTGFPAFVMLGWLASHVIPFGTVWWRVSLVSEVGMLAAVAALWFTLAELETPPWIATAAAWIFAFGEAVWQHATHVEVHALAVGLQALALMFAVRFNRGGESRWLLASCACAGFALATHPIAIWVLPGVGLLALIGVRRPSMREVLTAVVCTILPLSLYLYILPRSMWLASHRVDPTLALGVPPGQPFWNYGNPSTLGGFWWLISGQQYKTHGAIGALLNPLHDAQSLAYVLPFACDEYGWIALGVGVAGCVAAFVLYPRVAAALLLTLVLTTAFAFGYRTIEGDIVRYMLLSFWILSVFIGIAFATLARVHYGAAVASALAMILAVSAFWQHRGTLEQRTDPGSTALIARVRDLTPPNAAVIGTWLFSAPLGYARYADDVLGSRIVVNSEIQYDPALLNTLVTQRPTYVVFEGPFSLRGFKSTQVDDRKDPYIYKVTAPFDTPGGGDAAVRQQPAELGIEAWGLQQPQFFKWATLQDIRKNLRADYVRTGFIPNFVYKYDKVRWQREDYAMHRLCKVGLRAMIITPTPEEDRKGEADELGMIDEFFARYAQREPHCIEYAEMANEADLPANGFADVKAYARYYEAVAPIAARYGIKVVTTGTSGKDQPWTYELASLLHDANPRAPVDGFGFHPYGVLPGDMASAVTAMRKSAYGFAVDGRLPEVYVTEIGEKRADDLFNAIVNLAQVTPAVTIFEYEKEPAEEAGYAIASDRSLYEAVQRASLRLHADNARGSI